MKQFPLFKRSLIVACLALPASALQAAPLASGIDTSAFDPGVRVQDDFYGHINGRWAKATQIPASKARWGTYDQLRETAQEQVRTILDETLKHPGAAGSETRKITDLYESFVDETTRNALGVKPLQTDLARIDALRDKKDLPALMAYLSRTGVTTPFSLDVYQDARDATRHAVYASQSGLGLPDPDYYLKDDDTKLSSARAAYLQHVQTLLAMGGDTDAAAHAADILGLETALAKVQWTRVESRDALKTYNRVDFDALNARAPGFDWPAYLAACGLTGKTLRGVPENEPQWQLAQRFVDNAMGEAVGKLYVAQYFPPENKLRVQAMVDIWRDYSALKTQKDDLVANVRAARSFAYQRGVDKLGQPVDRGEWSMTPQTVNAQYSPLKNAITFPAALLQPPFFNVDAEDAVNYGAVGTSIGHEISHGFDDQGSQYDGLGNLRNWWTAEDRTNFTLRAAGLIQQYSAFSPVPGYFVNGRFTLGENIGDNSGVAIAYKAYRKSLGGKPSPVIDGLTGEQRLYIGFGIKYRSLQREDAAIMQVKTDPHSPGEFRVRGTVANQPGFYEAFGIQPGDKMYLPPEQRVIMW